MKWTQFLEYFDLLVSLMLAIVVFVVQKKRLMLEKAKMENELELEKTEREKAEKLLALEKLKMEKEETERKLNIFRNKYTNRDIVKS
jgi:hypothetical protein